MEIDILLTISLHETGFSPTNPSGKHTDQFILLHWLACFLL